MMRARAQRDRLATYHLQRGGSPQTKNPFTSQTSFGQRIADHGSSVYPPELAQSGRFQPISQSPKYAQQVGLRWRLELRRAKG
eukprot:8035558-Pyramimonas_sp.AAC.1